MKTFQEYLNESTDDAIKSKLRLLSAVGIEAEGFIKSGLVVVKSKESDATAVRKSMKRAAAKNTDGKHMEIKEDGFIYFAWVSDKLGYDKKQLKTEIDKATFVKG